MVSHDAVPDLTDQVLRADQAVKAELFTADRRLIIAGCSYYWPEAYSVAVLPRLYGAAFLSFGLATMDGLEGKNRCELHIWPVSEKPKPEVLVRWQPEYGGRDVCKWHFSDLPRRLTRVRRAINSGHRLVPARQPQSTCLSPN